MREPLGEVEASAKSGKISLPLAAELLPKAEEKNKMKWRSD